MALRILRLSPSSSLNWPAACSRTEISDPLCSPDSTTRHRLSRKAPLSERAAWNFLPPSTAESNDANATLMCLSRVWRAMIFRESARGSPDFR